MNRLRRVRMRWSGSFSSEQDWRFEELTRWFQAMPGQFSMDAATNNLGSMNTTLFPVRRQQGTIEPPISTVCMYPETVRFDFGLPS